MPRLERRGRLGLPARHRGRWFWTRQEIVDHRLAVLRANPLYEARLVGRSPPAAGVIADGIAIATDGPSRRVRA